MNAAPFCLVCHAICRVGLKGGRGGDSVIPLSKAAKQSPHVLLFQRFVMLSTRINVENRKTVKLNGFSVDATSTGQRNIL